MGNIYQRERLRAMKEKQASEHSARALPRPPPPTDFLSLRNAPNSRFVKCPGKTGGGSFPVGRAAQHLCGEIRPIQISASAAP